MLDRLKNNKAHIGVIGLGYVGLPLSIAFVAAGNKVTGFDIDVEKAEKLNAGQTCINHIGAYSVREMLETGRFSTSADFTALEKNFYHMRANPSKK